MQDSFGRNPNAIWWWGYLHSNGLLQLKRWFGDVKDYTEDCEGNDFVQQVVEPFIASDRATALRILNERLGGSPM
jgi:hypothetical protein